MDHRITIWLIALVGGTIALMIFLGMVASSLGPPGPAEAQAHTQSDGDPRDELLRVVAHLDAKLAQWRTDHGGAEPDFDAYPAWEQFLGRTTYRGTPVAPAAPSTRPATRPSDLNAAVGKAFGPYLSATPVNPVNRMTSVVRVAGPVRPGFRLGERAGFAYSAADGRFFGTNAIGRGIVSPRPPGPPAAQAQQ